MAQGEQWVPLSSARLQALQASIEVQDDSDGFVENQTRDETERDCDRALCDFLSPDCIQQQDSTEVLRTLVHRERLRGRSSATPVRRFCSVGPTNEPIPLAAQQAGSKLITIPSFESTQLRSDAAGIAAKELETVRDTAGKLVMGARKGPAGPLVRVQKRQRQRNQTSESMAAISAANEDEVGQ